MSHSNVKRIDPRRPFTITSAGLKRIVLGAMGAATTAAHGLPIDAQGAAAAAAHSAATRAAKPRRTTQPAQRALLVAAHSERGALDEGAREALAAAALLADAQTEVVLLVLGELTDDIAALGADKAVVLPSLDRRAFAPEQQLAALCACVAQFRPAHLLMPDNASGAGDLGRRYAAHAGVTITTHVVQIDAVRVASYAQAKKSYAVRALPEVVLLEQGAVDARLPFVGAGERVELSPPLTGDARLTVDTAYADLGIEDVDAADIALEEADFIVSAGNGVGDLAAFETLARAFGAAIGASRVAVDNGWFRRDQQIGATGKTVDASVYIAFGISGAVQHLQGIKDCRHVIAVNVDASAPIVKRANLAIISDAPELIGALNGAIESARAVCGTAERSAGLDDGARKGIASGIAEGVTV
jgi:electron transfer flavoprotein alpha subunit